MKKLILFLSLSLAINIFSQENTPVDRMIAEIQQIKQTNTSMKMVWWIPTEYWQVALKDQQNITAEQINYINSLFDDYTIIVAGDFSLIPKEGDIEFIVNDVKKSFLLLNRSEQEIPALEPSEIDENVLTLMNNILKPLFEQMLGKMGAGVEIFIYNNKDSSGKKIYDPKTKGNLNAKIADTQFDWKLPLVSLMKEKVCKTDGQKFPGNYTYCPFHGTEL